MPESGHATIAEAASTKDATPASATARARIQQELDSLVTRLPRAPARDITKAFTASANLLQPGQLIKDEHFTLFEAVGALEVSRLNIDNAVKFVSQSSRQIMDPKMDSGCVPPGDAFAPEFNVEQGLPAAEVLWIMDELFRLESIFHDGSPLAQNIFTSLHVFRLIDPTNTYPYNLGRRSTNSNASCRDTAEIIEEALVHVVLRAYCIGVIKSCEAILRLIQAHTSFEEEDFVTFLFGRELLPRLDARESMSIIAEALDWVDASSLDRQWKIALNHRLSIRADLLFALDNGSANDWRSLKTKVLQLKDTHKEAKPIDTAFSDKVQRQLATSTPPRPIPCTTWDDSCSQWSQLCDDMMSADELTRIPIRQDPFSLQRAAWEFAYRNPPPSAYARAKMQDLLTKEELVAGETAQFDLYLAELRDLVLAGDPLGDLASFQIDDTRDVRFGASRLIESFMSKAFGEYLNFYRIICLNRCRTRRQLTQLIPVLSELEGEAARTDAELNQIIAPREITDSGGNARVLMPLSLWAGHYKASITQHVIHLGFETELYLPDEYSIMYMGLVKTLETHVDILTTTEEFMLHRLRMLKQARKRHYVAECESALTFLATLKARAQMSCSLARCLADIYIVLENVGVIELRTNTYTKRQFRYEARMKPLLKDDRGHWPSIAQLDEIKAAKRLTVRGICDDIPRRIKAVKDLLSKMKAFTPSEAKYVGTEERWNKDIKQLEMICIAVNVAISQLDSVRKKNDIVEDNQLQYVVELVPRGKRYHIWWEVPQLRYKKNV